ncbi:MAG: Gfo/Idh/MocA family oxidoreductase [Lachnospiraceae bacterium]|nr:Gfo/Idh/MocA family oxidoreductase [Lachnospiraceae bacterium]
MRYALIGCGRISNNHVVAALNNGLEIVALCDIVPENAKDKIIKFDLADKNIRIYEDYREMLQKETPELVAIATESGKHAAIAIDCIEAGCNLIVEKPLALSLADADEIIRKSREKGVKVCACHQNRFNKSIVEIRKAIDHNRFGKLLYATAHIRWSRNHEYYDRAAWRGTWEQDGGALMNQCIHDIDLLRWMMGDEVELVCGMTDRLIHPYIQAEDLGIAIVKFKNGSYGIIEGTTDVYPRNLEETLYIFGEKGTVKAGGEAVNIIEEWRFADYFGDEEKVKEECSENPPNIYGFGHSKLYRNVIASIEGQEQLVVDAEAGKRALELVLAIYKSAATGETVRLPLNDCATKDFEGMFD